MVIDLLKELIKIDSRNPFEIEKINNKWILGGGETKITEFILEKLEEYGFKTEKQFVHADKNGQKYYNILAEKGEGDSAIMFYGHMDTVTANPWISVEKAFTPTIKKREVHGKMKDTLVALGSNDMKTGLAVMLEAFKDYTPKDYKIKLGFGVDEEFYSLGGNVLAESSFMNDVKALVVPEIADGPNKFMGCSTIGLGRLGRAEFIIEVYGTGGHGAISYLNRFVNAATEVSKIVQRLEILRNEHQDNFEFYQKKENDNNINEIRGSFFVSRIEAGDGSLSIPTMGKIIVDYTFTPNKDLSYMENLLNNLIDEMYQKGELRKVFISDEFKKIKIYKRERPTKYSGAFLTSEHDPFTAFVKEKVEEVSFFSSYNMGYSIADENVFKREHPNLPVLVMGPIGFNAHGDDEWVEVESVKNLLKVYRKIGMDFGEYLNR